MTTTDDITSALGAPAFIYRRSASRNSSTAARLEAQEKVCRERAAEEGLSVIKVFTDIGSPAQGGALTEMIRKLSAFSKNNADPEVEDKPVVLVSDISRLGRKMTENISIRNEIEQAGGRLIVADMQDYKRPTADLVMNMRAAQAEYRDTTER